MKNSHKSLFITLIFIIAFSFSPLRAQDFLVDLGTKISAAARHCKNRLIGTLKSNNQKNIEFVAAYLAASENGTTQHRYDVVRTHLSRGATPNANYLLSGKSYMDDTCYLLHKEISRPDADTNIVRAFLQAGAGPNTRSSTQPHSRHKSSLLQVAASQGHLEICKLLIDAKADVTQSSATACAATKKDHLPVLELLLNEGAPIFNNAPIYSGNSFDAISTAARWHNPDAVRFLLGKVSTLPENASVCTNENNPLVYADTISAGLLIDKELEQAPNDNHERSMFMSQFFYAIKGSAQAYNIGALKEIKKRGIDLNTICGDGNGDYRKPLCDFLEQENRRSFPHSQKGVAALFTMGVKPDCQRHDACRAIGQRSYNDWQAGNKQQEDYLAKYDFEFPTTETNDVENLAPFPEQLKIEVDTKDY